MTQNIKYQTAYLDRKFCSYIVCDTVPDIDSVKWFTNVNGNQYIYCMIFTADDGRKAFCFCEANVCGNEIFYRIAKRTLENFKKKLAQS